MRQMEMGGCFLFAEAAAALLSSLLFMRTAHAAEDLINNGQVQAVVAPQRSVVRAAKLSQFGNLMSICMDETCLGIHAHGVFHKSSSGTETMEQEPMFWQEDGVMTSDKILDPEPSLNPESKSTNARRLLLENNSESKSTDARKLLVENNSEKVCSGNTSKTLRIGVPLKKGFEKFVKVFNPCLYCNGTNICSSPSKQNITGYSIAVFKAAMEMLQDRPDYEYCVFGPSYDELVGNVSSGNLDGAAGDVTITSDRMNITDFTMPYTQSGVAMLVRRDRSDPIQWTFLTPLSKELWLAFVGFFCFTGFVIWMIERPKNPEYQGRSLMGQFSNAAYFAFSTLTFSHDQKIESPLSRSVVVIWCFLVLVLVQSYTASLSSLLTADRLQPSVKDLNQLLQDGDFVGHQDGTFVRSLLIHKNFSKEKLITYYSADDYAKALRKGSKNGGVSAIVDEVPYLKAFFASNPKYKEEFEVQGQIFRTPGFGFVFNSCHCRLVNDLSSKILNITQDGSIEKKWLGTSAADDASPTITKADYPPLTLRNFSGLFLVSGLVSSLMLLIRVVQLAYYRWTGAAMQTTGDTTATTLRNLSDLFLVSGLVSSLMLLISLAKLAHATEDAPDDDAVQTAGSTNPGDEQYQNTTGNIPVRVLDDHRRPADTNGDDQGGHT